jgi:hypothetical protein
MPPGADGIVVGTELEVHVGVGLQKFAAHVHNGRAWTGDLQVTKELGADPFIDQNTAMLRIVDEFHYIETAVVALKKMGLGSAAHFANQPAGVYRHLS